MDYLLLKELNNMKQTIEIEVPEGKKAVWKGNKIVFEDINPNLPKTWEEFCDIHNTVIGEFWISSNSEIHQNTKDSERFLDWDKNLLPSEQAAKQHLALMQLHQLRDCYRQGWEPNLINPKEDVWAINWAIDAPEVEHLIPCDSRFLSFNSKELAEEFLNNFRDLIEQAGDLI